MHRKNVRLLWISGLIVFGFINLSFAWIEVVCQNGRQCCEEMKDGVGQTVHGIVWLGYRIQHSRSN